MTKIITQRILLSLITLYTFCRLIFLAKLPIFNDESIYLNWGWREVHTPGALFYSLIDGKPPLLMWILGAAQSIVYDPLIAGRLVAITAGLVTLIGLYKLGETYFTKKTAILSTLLYLVIPLFTMYDRLALMESAVGACGVWSLYYFLRVIRGSKPHDSVILGIILGIGFLIKSNALIFLLSFVLLTSFYLIKNSLKRSSLIKSIAVVISAYFLTISLLIIQPLYWETFGMNSRYSLTLSELLHFPISHMIQNLLVNIQIVFFFVTPIIFLAICYGMYLLRRERKKSQLTIVLWSLLIFILQTILVRNTTSRYLVSYLPVFVLFASYGVMQFTNQYKKYGVLLYCFLFLLPVIMSVWQMVYPISLDRFYQRLTTYSDIGLTEGQTSGYGIAEIVTKLTSLTASHPAYIATAINIGNPESAIPLYFRTGDSIRTGYLDRRMFGDSLNRYQCLSSTVPIYYVSRDQQQSDMNVYFEEIYRVNHPISNYSLGIYQLKSDCKGETLRINPFQ